MFRRLCLFLLMIGLALPATAAPLHCAPAPIEAMASDRHGMHHDERKMPLKQTPKHDCIGCIAPYSTLAPPVSAELIVAAPHKPLGDFLLARLTSGPDTLPPRV